MNAECRSSGQGHAKPPQSHLKATPMRHQCDIKATPKPPIEPKQKAESRKQKCAQRHPGAKVEGRMQNAETAGKDIESVMTASRKVARTGACRPSSLERLNSGGGGCYSFGRREREWHRICLGVAPLDRRRQ